MLRDPKDLASRERGACHVDFLDIETVVRGALAGQKQEVTAAKDQVRRSEAMLASMRGAQEAWPDPEREWGAVPAGREGGGDHS